MIRQALLAAEREDEVHDRERDADADCAGGHEDTHLGVVSEYSHCTGCNMRPDYGVSAGAHWLLLVANVRFHLTFCRAVAPDVHQRLTAYPWRVAGQGVQQTSFGLCTSARGLREAAQKVACPFSRFTSVSLYSVSHRLHA